MRGITITGRVTVDGRDGGLVWAVRGAVWAEEHRRELGEAGDTGDTEAVEPKEAFLV